ncbi:MAG TPA: hypothetical protein VGG03_20785 [Thermoanaerobaculia bacterium]|jgi:hypothetical protein
MLVLAAALSFAIALLHLVIIFLGPEAYTYFGAAELGALEAQGSRMPDLLTLVLVAVFTVFGLYALSGASVIRRLPLLRTGLIAIGSIYTLRGLVVIPDLIRLVQGAGYPIRQAVFSAVSLAIGLAYLFGTARHWPFIRRPAVDRHAAAT